ncbi:hypothetical protein WJX81_000733 [Elliptochloris bilobata]|uniref:G domain-containing protein n=1 Tax=Elliptochloris bilobata TaxID=381761 RepID=A0AAW1RM08_9CHLO
MRSAISTQAAGAAARPARRQARVVLPACIVCVDASSVVAPGGGATEAVAAAVAGGATAVLLAGTGTTGGAELYEAACQLREVLRGRAVLLIEDRTDIVDAAEADGVVLSQRGVPTVVARRMMQSSGLVGRLVGSAEEAAAAASDGASLVILADEGGGLDADTIRSARALQPSSGSIPVVVAGGDAAAVHGGGADGVAVRFDQLAPAAAALSGRLADTPAAQVAAILEALGGEPAALALLQEVVPSMEETGLLSDALKQLDEPFLVVVVGEFNSGKSTVINALLGGNFLAEGILPTTNEISVLKFSGDGTARDVQDADGIFVLHLPSPLLADVNIVDTPGTNVILERQQRLTEEFVPRSDLVLFTMSADRPFTESEVRFLRYIRRWGKKVVFLLNKVDILATDGEVDEVAAFVVDNARRVLGVDAARVLAVSARSALGAKLAASGGGGFLAGLWDSAGSRGNGNAPPKPPPTIDPERLAADPRWRASRFAELERFMVDFLVGGAAGGESARLKLQTPLFVADALLDAAARQLAAELATAEQEAAAVRLVREQLATFRSEMARDGAAQGAQARRLITRAAQRAARLVDSTLQLSNADALSSYLFGAGKDARDRLPVGGRFEGEVVAGTAGQLRALVAEHSAWLRANCERQLSSYRSFVQQRATLFGLGVDGSSASEATALVAAASDAGALEAARPDSAAAAVARFEPRAAALLLEEEVREAVIGTAGAALGAGALGLVLTAVLPNILEDALAVALAAAVGYLALLNLPLRRAEAKGKVERVAANFAKDVEAKLEAELQAGLDACVGEVTAMVAPLGKATAAAVARLQDAEARCSALAEQLEGLKQRAAAVE